MTISSVFRPVLTCELTCPHCAHRHVETMPEDACIYFFACEGCGATLKPKPGDCCVFCSWGSTPCPPLQAEKAGVRTAGDGCRC